MDKPSFQNGILYHRLLIPAGGFYEWNSLKEKSTFTRPDSSVLYMAGFCDWFIRISSLFPYKLVVQYVYKHKGGFDYHEEKKVFQITILNADYHDYGLRFTSQPKQLPVNTPDLHKKHGLFSSNMTVTIAELIRHCK